MLVYRDGACSLTIPSVTPSDSGEYVCRATNSAGEVSTQSKVHVKGKTIRKLRFE